MIKTYVAYTLWGTFCGGIALGIPGFVIGGFLGAVAADERRIKNGKQETTC